MKGLKIFIATIVIGGLLQSCSTMEITQSRYGNGIGISFDKSNNVNEHDANHFRNRKSDEANHRKWMQQGNEIQSRQSSIQKTPNLEFENILTELLPLNTDAVEPLAINLEGSEHKIKVNKTDLNLNTPAVSKTELIPDKVEKTMGNTTSLGYLGGVLIIVGLVLFILGYPAAISLIALGVLLIVVAYFIG